MSKVRQISCEEALKSLLEYLDSELADERSHEIDQHLSTCRSCYSRLEFEKHLRSRLRETGRQEVPDSLRNRIDALFVRKDGKQGSGG
ncbi:MAG: zf-HC2 domain-containing protein [Gammaproteobacteria bacterium]